MVPACAAPKILLQGPTNFTTAFSYGQASADDVLLLEKINTKQHFYNKLLAAICSTQAVKL